MKRLRVGILALVAACAGKPAPASPDFDDAPTEGASAPATGARCPNSIATAVFRQTHGCLDAAVHGPDIVAECGALLERRGWRRDHASEARLASEGLKLVCYRAP